MNRLKGLAFLFLDNILYLLYAISFGLIFFTLNIQSIYHFEISSGWILLDLLSLICLLCVGRTIRKLSVKDCGILDYLSFALKPDYYVRIGGNVYEVNTKGNQVSVLKNGTGGLGMIVILFFRNIILAALTILFLPFQIIACLISNKYSSYLANYFDNEIEIKKAILPSIFLTISLLLSVTTISVRLPHKNHSIDNDFTILVTRKDVDIKRIEKNGYKEAFRVFYNVTLSVEKYPNNYSISGYLIMEDAEGHKQGFSQSVQSFLGKTSVEHYNGVIDFTFNKECGITESGNKEGYDELIKLNTAKVYLDISTINYGDGCKWNYRYDYYRYELKEKL